LASGFDRGFNGKATEMPQIIFFALVGIVAYVGYRSFVKEAQRVTAKVRRQEQQSANGAIGTLVKDPKTGEYRLAKD
jgi:membrane protein implicated in regulation of membrane protease activity